MKLEQKKIIVLLVVFLLSFTILSFSVFADTAQSNSFVSDIGEIARFFKRLVVPEPNYFHNKLGALSQHINERLGGVSYLYQMINNFFKQLKNVPDVSLAFSLPDNFLFPGYRGFSYNFFESARPYVKVFRDVATATCYLSTAIICYHKLRTFFQQGDNT